MRRGGRSPQGWWSINVYIFPGAEQMLSWHCRRDAEALRVLGLPGSSCSRRQIREAYIRAVKLNHPDLAGNRSAERFLDVQKAYRTLMQQRQQLDADDTRQQVGERVMNFWPQWEGGSSWRSFQDHPANYRKWSKIRDYPHHTAERRTNSTTNPAVSQETLPGKTSQETLLQAISRHEKPLAGSHMNWQQEDSAPDLFLLRRR